MTRPRAATALLVLALAALAGCGSADPAGPAASAPAASAPSASASSPTAPAGGDASGRPGTVVLTRSGGLAGNADRLDVAPDGTVTGTTKAGPVECRIDAGLATALVVGPAPTVAPAAGTDRMTISLDRLGTVVELGEAQGGDPVSEAARTLLDDLALPAGQRTVCR